MRPEIAFTCNVCGSRSAFQEQHYVNPEMSSCSGCGSNVRLRWLVNRLSRELFGRNLTLSEFPFDRAIKGIGLTDPDLIARGLVERFTYRNTFLTTEPRLDIRSDPSPIGRLDFLIASEVFEHVEPPVMMAFRNAASLLKQSGILLLTVPWVWDGERSQAIPELYDWRLDPEGNAWTVVNRRLTGGTERFLDMAFDGGPGPSLGNTREHFPQLHQWRLVNDGESWRLVNKRRDGELETFENLVFHEGPGLALEMRLFTKCGLEECLREAGFDVIEFEIADYPEAGIIFSYPWSRPLVARLQR